MRLAVIDCGTNTFNLIVVELLDKKKIPEIIQHADLCKIRRRRDQ